MNGTDLLQVSSRAVGFLGRHVPVSRSLGGSGDRTDRFTAADSSDRDAMHIRNWSGILDDQPYQAGDLEDFRGLPQLSDLKTPLYYEQLTGEQNWGVKHHDPRREAVDQKSALELRDAWFAGHPTFTEAVYGDGESAIRELLATDDALRSAYTRGRDANAYEQEMDLAAEAGFWFEGTEEADWRDQEDFARMALENRGGLADKLQASGSLRDMVGADGLEQLVSESRQRVLDELLPMLENSSDTITEEFLQQHPLTALELLDNSGLRRDVEEDPDKAAELVADADRIEGEVKGELAQRAASRINDDLFNENWFTTEGALAEAVVSDGVTDADNSFADWLRVQEGYTYATARSPELIENYWADRAYGAVEGALDRRLFAENPSLAMMTSLNTEVAEDLASDADAIATAYPEGSELNGAVRAYRAYGLGLADRRFGTYTRVA